MEKNHDTIAAVGGFEFPEEIIHQIQSFMCERKATRTTLVSKSWYGAWSTRPILSFSQYELRKRFRQYATKTLQRYEDLNLNIQTFSLWMRDDDSDLARELILKAIKLGAVDLTIDIISVFETYRGSRILSAFVLPDEVLESETLARLSVYGCKVDLERRNKPLTSSNLKSLCTLTDTVTIGDLNRRFPLLEKLKMEGYFNPSIPLYGCTTKLNKLKILKLKYLNTTDSLSKSELWLQFPCLKTLVIWECKFKDNGEDVIRIRSPSLEFLTIGFRFTEAKLEFDVPNIRKFKFRGSNVPRLELKTSSREWESDVRISCPAYVGVPWLRSLKQFVKVLSPSRVFLDLFLCHGQLGVEYGFVRDGLAYIGSVSWLRWLKQFVKVLSPSRLSLALYLCYLQQLDVAIPEVENLAYIGSVSWLRSLKQFVKALSPSRLSLALYLSYQQLGVEDGFVGDGLAIPGVENLTICGGTRVSPAFLNALFGSCHPNFVKIGSICVSGIEKENVDQFQHLSFLPWNRIMLNESRFYVRFKMLRFNTLESAIAQIQDWDKNSFDSNSNRGPNMVS